MVVFLRWVTGSARRILLSGNASTTRRRLAYQLRVSESGVEPRPRPRPPRLAGSRGAGEDGSIEEERDAVRVAQRYGFRLGGDRPVAGRHDGRRDGRSLRPALDGRPG